MPEECSASLAWVPLSFGFNFGHPKKTKSIRDKCLRDCNLSGAETSI